MDQLRVLLVDDDDDWRALTTPVLEQLGPAVVVETANSHSAALTLVAQRRYDLAIVDLELPLDAPALGRKELDAGLSVLRALRESRINSACAAIVLTAQATSRNTRLALRDYAVSDFVEKEDFRAGAFAASAKAAMRDARIKQARQQLARLYTVRLNFDAERLVSSELLGPRERSYDAPLDAPRVNLKDLARRADNLNLLVLKGEDVWREDARSIGESLFLQLFNNYPIIHALVTARARAHSRDICLEFSGPAESLGVPFELLHYKKEFLGLEHALVRRLQIASNKIEPFHQFIATLSDKGEPLRALIIAADPDGSLPSVADETARIETLLRAECAYLGLQPEITLLRGADASYANVARELREGHHHLLHYAGHGRFDDQLPEVSGLILADDDATRQITAAHLHQLLRESDHLRLAFLSCCFGARTSQQAGRGDFHGILEAVARADVPVVLGYRWTVQDATALRLAEAFYTTLWRTLSPRQAIFDARRTLVREQGADDDTWAAPLLLLQTD